MKAPIKGENVFDYSYHPFECKSFILKMDMGVEQIPTKIMYFYFGIKPIILVISSDTNYGLSIELKIWKSSFTFNLRLWS